MKTLPENANRKQPHWQVLMGSLILILMTVAVYWPVTTYEFINYDDPVYITGNDMVQKGLRPETIMWALTTMEAQFWHPLTWLSHMLDCQFFGLNPGGHHLTNLLLHLASTLLLFGVLRRMTGTLWRSGLVSALFALHPLHVESVAWAAERKDVLSTLFWMLTLWAYCHYVEKCEVRSAKCEVGNVTSGEGQVTGKNLSSRVTRHASLYYWLALLFFALGLMAKPMLVTLPFVLLLLDYWPLRRFELSIFNAQPSALLRLVKEKISFLVLAAIAGVVAFIAQERGGAVSDLGALPVGVRLSNAVVSYVRYLQKTIWPADLSVYYPHPGAWPVGLTVGAAVFLTLVTVVVIRHTRTRPWLPAGWFWYVGTLVPVIGLVQVGRHAMADRYTYIPLIGIFVMVVWEMSIAATRLHWSKAMTKLAVGLVVAVCATLAAVQLRHWKDSETLFRHALRATRGDYRMHNSLGAALFEKGRLPEAIDHYEEALRLQPDDPEVHSNLGNALFRQGRTAEGIGHLEESLRLDPNDAAVHYNLGNALFQMGRLPEALARYEQVVRLKPDFAKAHYNLGVASFRLGQASNAVPHFEQALRLKPDYVNAQINLGTALLQLGRAREAGEQCQRALQLKPDSADALDGLSRACLQLGQLAEAVRAAERACQLTTNGVADHLETLGMAYSEAGRFQEAMQATERAVVLARQIGNQELAALIESRLKYYRAGRAFHAIPKEAGP